MPLLNLSTTAIFAMLLLGAATQNPPAPAAPASQGATQPAVSVNPPVIAARGSFGQAITQTLTVTNQTGAEISLAPEAYDTIVKDGKRVSVPAGETAHSIAATAVFSHKTFVVKPHSSASVEIRITPPAETAVRAVSVVFHDTKAAPGGNAGRTASTPSTLSALITFNLTSDVKIEADVVRLFPSRETGNLNVALWMTNTGSEPVAPEGVVEMLDAAGKPAAKAAFPSLHLLPGEKLDFAAEFPEPLPPGNYKVLCSFQFEGKTLTKESTFSVM